MLTLLTWTHIIRATATEIVANWALDRKSKVGQTNIGAIVRTEDILGFDVTMKNP
jgi:hypothetical protein